MNNFEIIVAHHGEICWVDSFRRYWVYNKINTIIKKLTLKVSLKKEEIIRLITVH